MNFKQKIKELEEQSRLCQAQANVLHYLQNTSSSSNQQQLVVYDPQQHHQRAVETEYIQPSHKRRYEPCSQEMPRPQPLVAMPPQPLVIPQTQGNTFVASQKVITTTSTHVFDLPPYHQIAEATFNLFSPQEKQMMLEQRLIGEKQLKDKVEAYIDGNMMESLRQKMQMGDQYWCVCDRQRSKKSALETYSKTHTRGGTHEAMIKDIVRYISDEMKTRGFCVV